MVLCLFVSGCSPTSGPGSIQPGGQPNVLVETNQKLSTAPHLFDVYRATNADKAIVFLHGATGTKHFFAYQLGLIPSSVEGDYIGVDEQTILGNKVLAVFPQGQAVLAAPLAFTWSNYVMTSGQDDVQFLRDLVAYLSAHYQITRFYIVGHSNGGMMANRIWCEQPDLFEGYVAIAGPPSERFLAPETACAPSVVKPYIGIVGSQDDMLQVTGNWEAATWSINPLFATGEQMLDPVIIGERYYLSDRVSRRCGESVMDGDADAVTDGNVTSWSFCGDSIKLLRIESGKHTLESLQSTSGKNLLDFVFDFIQ